MKRTNMRTVLPHLTLIAAASVCWAAFLEMPLLHEVYAMPEQVTLLPMLLLAALALVSHLWPGLHCLFLSIGWGSIGGLIVADGIVLLKSQGECDECVGLLNKWSNLACEYTDEGCHLENFLLGFTVVSLLVLVGILVRKWSRGESS